MDSRPPHACRLLIAAAGRVVPRALRAEWRRRWDREVYNWWAFMAEHGAFDRDARAELIRHCWGAFPDALGTRVDLGPRLASFVRGPMFCLGLAALPLLLAAAFSHGFSGLRAVATPLPYRDAQRVVAMAWDAPFRIQDVPPAALAPWRKAVRLEGIAAFRFEKARLENRAVLAARVEPGFFDLLGATPAQGRLLGPQDGSGAAVLSYAAWKRLVPPGSGAVVLNGRKVPVIGVLPAGFWFFRREVAVWTVMSPSNSRVGAVARLKSFATDRDAERELTRISEELPGHLGRWVQLLPLAERLRSAGRWCAGLSLALLAAGCALAIAGFRRHPRGALFLAAKVVLLVSGLALGAIELPAAVYGAGAAGGALLVQLQFPILAALAVAWAWHDQRRRCRTCLHRLTLPVHFGTLGSPLLERVGVELVCPNGHGSLYVPGMHWSASQPERWTPLDSSYTDLFKAP